MIVNGGMSQPEVCCDVDLCKNSPASRCSNHEFIDKSVVIIATKSGKFGAVVKRVFDQFLIVSSNVENDWQHTVRSNASNRAIQRKFSNTNA